MTDETTATDQGDDEPGFNINEVRQALFGDPNNSAIPDDDADEGKGAVRNLFGRKPTAL